jgi:hypothetical protein
MATKSIEVRLAGAPPEVLRKITDALGAQDVEGVLALVRNSAAARRAAEKILRASPKNPQGKRPQSQTASAVEF